MIKMTGTKYLLFNNVLSALVDEQQGGLSWWAWVLIIILVIVLLLILWWWLGNFRKKGKLPAKPAPPIVTSHQQSVSPVTTSAPIAPIKPDDLAIIEGIGPKIAGVLQAAGIVTFKQLAEADVSHVEQVLKDAGLRLADPKTWAAQATLAAENKWDELKALQDSLKGGRYV